MTFYEVQWYEDGYRSAHYVSKRETAAELVARIRQSGVREIATTKVRLDSLGKQALLRALNAAANGHSFGDIANVEHVNI